MKVYYFFLKLTDRIRTSKQHWNSEYEQQWPLHHKVFEQTHLHWLTKNKKKLQKTFQILERRIFIKVFVERGSDGAMAVTIRSGLVRVGDREATALSDRSDGSWGFHATHAPTFLRFSESGVSSLNYTVFPFDVTLDAPLTWCIRSKVGGFVEWNKRFRCSEGMYSDPS